ncbi:helicase [Candidatus Saccharibacteria bacterium CG_4_10_14_0_2_um_filter_52_9]|nr:MAG: helicase [Candidatus Saccharibacteria bacterium CG_4_10_14_0_2_um_filter_52_9]
MRQAQALSVMMSGANVFLTGAPGAGKTYVLNRFIQRAERAGKRVAVTASTGIAASHLGGTTIHSWSGLGILDELLPEDLKRLGGSDRLLKRYNATDVLVIDEVSMLHGQRLDMVNQMAKLLRSSEAPFGGMQVILVGDLFQLPPITRGSQIVDFAHMSQSWAELDLQICYLTEQHRQAGNDALLGFLEAMRSAEVSDDHFEVIKDRLQIQPDEATTITRLYSHNVDVDSINDRHLKALPGSLQQFGRQTKGSKAKLEQLAKSLLVPETLLLKTGAEVMFVANNFGEGYVNGSRGRVIDFEYDVPVVQLINGRKIRVEPNTWSLSEDGKIRAEITQLPLRLAWAITIHKSQGMSLDSAEIDLSRAFTPGMGYVALSRVRSLDGLYLKGLNSMAFVMHPQIHEFDEELRRESVHLAANTDDIGEEQPVKAAVFELDEDLFEDLKSWRLQRAQSDGVAAYMIAHNAGLQAVASAKPATPQQLLALPGFGSKKVESYGSDILAIIANHAV